MESMVFFSNDLEPYALVQEACDGDDPIIRIVLLGYLVIKVWDRDLGNPDDFLGQVIIPLSSLPLCPSHLAEVSQEKWYNLTRQSTKNEMSRGKLQLKMQLEAIEENVMLINDELDCNLFTITKAIGFQIPVKFNSQITEYPGPTEKVELAFLKVYVDFSGCHSEAMVFLTNYRLIILSVGDLKTNKVSSPPLAISYNSTDISMWIALNNISHIEHGAGNMVIRRLASTGAENVQNYTITIHCHDCRSIQLVFIAETFKEGINRRDTRDPKQALPNKLLNQITTQLKKDARKKKKENAIKMFKKLKKKKTPKKMTLSPAMSGGVSGVSPKENRRRSDAFLTEMGEEVYLPNEGSEDYIDGGDDDEVCSLDDYLRYNGGIKPEYDDISHVESLLDDEVVVDLLQKPHILELERAYQGLTLPQATKQIVDLFLLKLDEVVSNAACNPPAFNFLKYEDGSDIVIEDWDITRDLREDMRRMMNDNWRECNLNSDYTLCSTYPPYVYLPATVDVRKREYIV
jgi:hypothetical protein